MGSHAHYLQLQGEDKTLIEAVSRAQLDDAPIDDKRRALLELVHKTTVHAHRVDDADIDHLRTIGWTDPEIAEAVYVAALFAFFNRVADVFGLEDPKYDEHAKDDNRFDSQAERED